jgi:lycopene cyclase domain-containing protein
VIPVYPLLAVIAAAVVAALELRVFRTGIFRLPAYWIAMGIVLLFMIPVDGWMSKRSDPIVIYSPAVLSGIRFPWDIPLEEFVYAWAMVTLALVLWERTGQREARSPLPLIRDGAAPRTGSSTPEQAIER